MLLEKLEIRNFQSFKEATIYLKDRGLVSIQGLTHDLDGADSNGSGKSTLINAILWCNYGDCGKKLDSVDDVINYKAGKDCSVSCTWYDNINDVRYNITRYRKHSKFKNAAIVHLITAEDDIVDISKGTDPETQIIINEILGADKRTFEASCFSRQTNAPDIPGMTDGELKLLLEKVLPFDDLNGWYKTANDNLNSHKRLIEELERDLEKAQTRLEDTSEEWKKADEAWKNWDSEVIKAKRNSEIQIEELEQSIAELTGDLMVKPQSKIDAAILLQEKIINDFDHTTYNDDLASYKLAHRTFEKAHNDYINSDELSVCGSCGQNVDDPETLRKHLEAEWKKAEISLEAAKDKFDGWRNKQDAFFQAQTKLRKLQILDRENQQKRSEIGRLEASLTAVQDHLDTHRPNPHGATLERLLHRTNDLMVDKEAAWEQLKEANEKLPVLEAVAETFSPKGVRYHILEDVTPALNSRTNYYLSQLTDGKMKAIWSTVTKLKSGDYREKFSINVTGDNFKGYGSLSGGEQRKVKLSCFFALQDLIASRASKSINLWCGDEIDHALDGAGLERLMNLLHEKTRTKSTILVISHNDLKAWIPNSGLVIKKDGISTVTGYLSDNYDNS